MAVAAAAAAAAAWGHCATAVPQRLAEALALVLLRRKCTHDLDLRQGVLTVVYAVHCVSLLVSQLLIDLLSAMMSRADRPQCCVMRSLPDALLHAAVTLGTSPAHRWAECAAQPRLLVVLRPTDCRLNPTTECAVVRCATAQCDGMGSLPTHYVCTLTGEPPS